MHLRARQAKNAVSNLVRGGSTTLVSLFLPAVLVRHMSLADYSIWVLILQISAYCIYLEFGFQTAVGRYIAIAVEKKNADEASAVYSTALAGLCCAAALALAGLLGVALAARWLFPAVPETSLQSMRLALLIVGSSVGLGLPSFAWTGVFIGLERNEIITLISGGGKLLVGLCVAIAASHGASVVVLAVVAATINILSYCGLYLLVRKTSFVHFRLSLISKATARELFSYCYSLMIWNLSMLLINGLDLVLVGRFEFLALAPFAIASALVGTVQGMQLAVFNATMPRAAVLHARNEIVALGQMVVRNTQRGVLLLLLVGMPLLIYARPILRAWVGPQYVSSGRTLLIILMVANTIRLVATPYTVVLVAAGQQRYVVLSPTIEGMTNLLASVFLGIRYGAIGVAAGTLLGAVVGLLGHIFYNLPRTSRAIELRVRDFLIVGVGQPVCAMAALILFSVYTLRHQDGPNPFLFAAVAGLTVLSSAFLVRKHGRTNQRGISSV